MASVVELNVTVSVPPAHIVAPAAEKSLEDGNALVVKEAVLTLLETVQLGVEVKAIAVILTTFDEPAVAKAEVVKVPVPGLPDVKLIVAVVELTVLVPLTL